MTLSIDDRARGSAAVIVADDAVRSFYRVAVGCWQSFNVPSASADA